MERYCIKSGYMHREKATYFDDTGLADEWQKEVYLRVRDLMMDQKLTQVADVGCGSGYKLVHYLGDFVTTGYDVPQTVDYLRKTYPDRSWKIADFSERDRGNVPVVVCSDVIEHVENPDELMKFIAAMSNKWVVLSTPDRDLAYQEGSPHLNGPPENGTHLREWSFNEFNRYISKYISIEEHYISNRSQATQIVVGVTKK